MAWLDLNEGTTLRFKTNMATVSWPEAGRVDVVGIGSDDALWIRTFVDGNWREWKSLGGICRPIQPAICSWKEHRLEIFVVGTDEKIWNIYADYDYGESVDQWSDWNRLGGDHVHSITCASPGEGRTELFYNDGYYVRRKWYDGDWHDADGTEFYVWAGVRSMAMASRANGLVDCFARYDMPQQRCMTRKGYNIESPPTPRDTGWGGIFYQNMRTEGQCVAAAGVKGANKIHVFFQLEYWDGVNGKVFCCHAILDGKDGSWDWKDASEELELEDIRTDSWGHVYKQTDPLLSVSAGSGNYLHSFRQKNGSCYYKQIPY